MSRLLFAIPLAIFVGVAVWFLIGLLDDRAPGTLDSALIDRPAPAFDLPPLPGRAEAAGFADTDLGGGEVALVNVFASWCVPCRVEHPLVSALADEHGLPVHGIAYKDDPEDSLAFLRELGDSYTRVGVDRDGRAGIEWGVYGVPETYVVDGEGVVRYRHAGALTPRVVENEILPLVEELRR